MTRRIAKGVGVMFLVMVPMLSIDETPDPPEMHKVCVATTEDRMCWNCDLDGNGVCGSYEYLYNR